MIDWKQNEMDDEITTFKTARVWCQSGREQRYLVMSSLQAQ